MSIAARPSSPPPPPAFPAARPLECLLEIQSRFADRSDLPAPVVERLASLREHATSPQMLDVVYRAAGSAMQTHFNQIGPKASLRKGDKSDAKLEALMELIHGGGPYEDFAIALRASRENDHNTVVAAMDRFLAAPKIPIALKRFNNEAQAPLRPASLYSLQQYDRAALHLRQVTKQLQRARRLARGALVVAAAGRPPVRRHRHRDDPAGRWPAPHLRARGADGDGYGSQRALPVP